MEFIGKVFKFHLVPFCSFSMFDFAYPTKNPVNADFTEVKRKDRMRKISVVFCIYKNTLLEKNTREHF